MKQIKPILSIISIGILTACGGSGGDNSNDNNSAIKKQSVTGKAIDGYLSGATVFLDINGNSVLDSDEPYTITTESGDYELSLNEYQTDCYSYVPIIVDVPVGAIDEDLGEVLEAYRMVLPPQYSKDMTDAYYTNKFITPFTSILWNTAQVGNIDEHKSCDQIKNDISAIEKRAELIEDTVKMTVASYNISEEELFSDYIATGHIELQATGERIVKGLQASYSETTALNNEYPDATWANVTFFMEFREDDSFDWIRETYLDIENTNIMTSEIMNPNLKDSYGFRYKTERVYESFEGTEFSSSLIRGYDIAEDRKSSVLTDCTAVENLVTNKYEVINEVQLSTHNTVGFDENTCDNVNFESSNSQQIVVRDDILKEHSKWLYEEVGHVIGLESFVNMKNTYKELDLSLLPVVLSDFNPLYDVVELNDAYAVLKYLEWTDEDQTEWVESLRYEISPADGYLSTWNRVGNHLDGTRTYLVSNDGQTWVEDSAF